MDGVMSHPYFAIGNVMVAVEPMTCRPGDYAQAFLLQSVPKPFTMGLSHSGSNCHGPHSVNFLTGVGRVRYA